MRELTENEMLGFLKNLPSYITKEQRVQAVIEYFFTHNVFHDMSSEYGLRFAKNLLKFVELAKL